MITPMKEYIQLEHVLLRSTVFQNHTKDIPLRPIVSSQESVT